MKAVVTVLGQDRVGIIAKVSGALAEQDINVLDISQTILEECFMMVMIVDVSAPRVSFKELGEVLGALGKQIGMEIRIQRTDIFEAMHRL